MQFARVLLPALSLLLMVTSASAESGAAPSLTPIYGAEAHCIGALTLCGDAGTCPEDSFAIESGTVCECIGKKSTCTESRDCADNFADECFVYEGPTCTGDGPTACADGFHCMYSACVHALDAGELFVAGTKPPTATIDASVMMVDPDAGDPVVGTDLVVHKDDSGCSAAGRPGSSALLPTWLALAWLVSRRKRG
jgi:uncharacterized protein (TIGR03382 family)